MTVKQLLSRKVCQIGPTNFCCESRQTKQITAKSAALSYLGEFRCKTIDLSLLHCELVIDLLSAVMAYSSWLGSVHLSSSPKVLR